MHVGTLAFTFVEKQQLLCLMSFDQLWWHLMMSYAAEDVKDALHFSNEFCAWRLNIYYRSKFEALLRKLWHEM